MFMESTLIYFTQIRRFIFIALIVDSRMVECCPDDYD